MAMIYACGLVKDDDTCILEVKRSIDHLSPELWQFLGLRATTKVALKAKRPEILAWVNQTFDQAFTRLAIE